MLLKTRYTRIGLGLAALIVIALLAFVGTQLVSAAHDVNLSCSPSSAPAGSKTAIICTGDQAYTFLGGTDLYCGFTLLITFDSPVTGINGGWTAGGDLNAENSWVHWNELAGFTVHSWTNTGCGRSPFETIAPGIWAMAVCEPNDGFSPDLWLSLDSNANSAPAFPPTLYVAASGDGPWYETEFLQAPYVMSQSQVEALTAWMGLTDYHELWFKASVNGTGANLGSMITDREGDLPALCGE